MNNNLLHPEEELLANYVLRDDRRHMVEIDQHVQQCRRCAKTVGELRSVETALSELSPDEFDSEDEMHINDNEIVSFVNNLLSSSTTQLVQNHIDDCGACMKAVLRYRSYLAEHNSVSSKTTAYSHIQSLLHPIRNKLFSVFKTRLPIWSIIPIAAMASIAILIIPTGDNFGIPSFRNQFFNNVNSSTPLLSDARSTTPVVKVSLRQAGPSTRNSINWYDGYVETSAIGTANLSAKINTIQAEQLALKAARHSAYANITEMLNGISVNSNTSYQNLVSNGDALKIKSQGFIRGGQIISQLVEWHDNSPKATVTVRVPLYGNQGLQGLLDQQPATTIAQPSTPTINTLLQAKYSGIIIDARKTRFTPAMTAQLQTVNEELIYASPVGFNSPISSDIPSINYYSTVEQALGSKQFGANPVVIEASQARQVGALSVSNQNVIDLLRDISDNKQRGLIKIAIVFDASS